ncbi:MAG: PAS domain S-box protein, partial [Alphaproteobacteria bacterium]|nr:PAS domain S-box protein [Alphaproteobacteria bacterium]
MTAKIKKAKRPQRKPAARKVAAPRKRAAPRRPARQPSARAAALALLAPDGPLGTEAAPALVVAAGTVLAANPAGASLGEGLTAGRAPALARLVEAATAADVARKETLRAGRGVDGNPLTLEMTALPLADGAVLLLGRDATLDHNLRGALVDSRQRYKDLVEISSDFAWETGSRGTFVFVSPQGALGWRADELVGHDPRELLADNGGGDDGMALAFQADKPVQGAELWLRRADGDAACVVTTATPLFDENAAWRGARGVCRDVTDERRRDSALARAESRTQLLNYIVAAIRDDIVPQRMLDDDDDATAR